MKLVILDRDGVINYDSKQFIKSPAEWRPIPGSLEAIARLTGVTEAGSVTYQSVETLLMGTKLRLYVVGYELGRPGAPEDLVAGRPIARAHFEMVADVRTGLEPGDRIRLGGGQEVEVRLG